MGFLRALVSSAATLVRPARAGDGLLAFFTPVVVTADAAATLTVAQLAGGLIQFTGFTAGRVLTTPTAVLLLAANPDMDVGDSFTVIISVTTAFAATYSAGVGVTLAGRATTVANTYSIIVITKLSSTTVEWRVL